MSYFEQSKWPARQYFLLLGLTPYSRVYPSNGGTNGNQIKEINRAGYRFLKCILAILCLVSFSGCASVKSYSGPDLPDEKLATIALKAPATALIPLFWIFPFNMLNWFSDDWRETSSTDAKITVNDVELNRFRSVQVMPGVREVNLKQTFIFGQRSAGATRCSNSCTCTEKQENGVTTKTCSISCETPMEIIGQDRLCHIFLSTEAGQRYEAFVRNDYLKINDMSKNRTLDATCRLSSEHHTPFTEKSSIVCEP